MLKVLRSKSAVPQFDYEQNWQFKMLVNGFGSICTAIVMCVFAVTKFHDGAYIVLLLMPLLIGLFSHDPPPLQQRSEPSFT